MASHEVSASCPCAGMLSSCCKEIIKNKNKGTSNTKAGSLPLRQLSERPSVRGNHRRPSRRGSWVTWFHWVDLQLYLPGLDTCPQERLSTRSLCVQHYKFPLGSVCTWNWEWGLWMKAEGQLEKDERKVTFTTCCVTRAIYSTLVAPLLPKVTFGFLNVKKLMKRWAGD